MVQWSYLFDMTLVYPELTGKMSVKLSCPGTELKNNSVCPGLNQFAQKYMPIMSQTVHTCINSAVVPIINYLMKMSWLSFGIWKAYRLHLFSKLF